MKMLVWSLSALLLLCANQSWATEENIKEQTNDATDWSGDFGFGGASG